MKPLPSLLGLTLAFATSLIGWLALYGPTTSPLFFYDDSYITLSNALELNGVANKFGAPLIAGSTSPAHVLVTALFAAFMPPEPALAASAVLATTLFIAGLLRLGEACRAPAALGAAVAAICTWSGLMMFHLFNGLETGLALAAICWSMAWVRTRSITKGLLAAATLPWIRPELAALSAVLGVWAIRSEPASSPRRGASPSTTQWCLILAAALSIVAALGWPQLLGMPSTSEAKRLWFAEDCLPWHTKLDWAASALGSFAKVHGPTLLGLVFLSSQLRWIFFVFGGTLVFALSSQFPGGMSHYDLRYLYLLTPFALIGLLDSQSSDRKDVRIAGMVATCSAALWCLFLSIPENIKRADDARRFTQNHLIPVTDALNKVATPNSLIAIHDAGYIGYALKAGRVVDIVGLKTPESSEFHSQLTHPSCGALRSYATSELASYWRPNFLVVLRRWDEIFSITRPPSSTKPPYTLIPIRLDANGYDLYKVQFIKPNSSQPPEKSKTRIPRYHLAEEPN